MYEIGEAAKIAFLFLFQTRSPALKPLWISLGGSDAETLFSGLFRKFFCHASRDYFAGLSAAKETLHQKVVPAYLLHIKDLALGLGLQRHSSIIIMETTQPQLSASTSDLVDSAALVTTSTKVKVGPLYL